MLNPSKISLSGISKQAVEVVRTVDITGAAAFKHQSTEEAPFPFGWQGSEDILLVDSEVG